MILSCSSSDSGQKIPPNTNHTSSKVPKVKAHRGASAKAPENTLASVQLAFASGADAVEIDVRLSSDEQVVVFHDADTRRIGGRDLLVRRQTLAQLRELDVGAWKSPEYQGERIATLTEILAVIPPDKTIFVEIKDGLESVAPVAEAIQNADCPGIVAIESFDAAVLRAVREQLPSVKTHITLGAKQREDRSFETFPVEFALHAKQAGFDGISADARGVTADFANAVSDKGLSLAVWTINSKADLGAFRSMPISWIETDLPGMIAEELNR